MTREVNVELLKPWSIVSIRYRSTAYRLRSSRLLASDHVQVVVAVAEVGPRLDHVQPAGQPEQPGRQHRHERGQPGGLRRRLLIGLVGPRPAAERLGGQGDRRSQRRQRARRALPGDRGQQLSDAVGQLAPAGRLASERGPLLRRRQVAAQQQVPRVLHAAAARDVDGVVAAVVVEALASEHVGHLRPGDRHPGQPRGCLVRCVDNVC